MQVHYGLHFGRFATQTHSGEYTTAHPSTDQRTARPTTNVNYRSPRLAAHLDVVFNHTKVHNVHSVVHFYSFALGSPMSCGILSRARNFAHTPHQLCQSSESIYAEYNMPWATQHLDVFAYIYHTRVNCVHHQSYHSIDTSSHPTSKHNLFGTLLSIKHLNHPYAPEIGTISADKPSASVLRTINTTTRNVYRNEYASS